MTTVKLQSSPVEHANEIRTLGYTVVEDVLTPKQIEKAITVLDQIFEYEKQHGDRVLWDNNYYQVSFFVIAKHEIFREVCQAPKLVELARLVLGEDCIIGSVNGYSPRPGGLAQRLHPDRILDKGFIGSLTANLALDAFTSENGCTRIVPGSQGHEVPAGVRDKTFGCREMEPRAIDVVAPAGAVVIYDASIVHSSGANRTSGLRRSVHVSFLKPWIQPEWDFSCLPESLKADLTEEESRLFGLHLQPQRYDVEQHGLRSLLTRLKSKLRPGRKF
jgi:Protein involved in biosynthesis of mitomycin antibiotics/polyketide fumonisin